MVASEAEEELAGGTLPPGLLYPLKLPVVLKVVDSVPGNCVSIPIGAASTSLLGPPPGLLTPPVATDLSQNARHLQVGWVSILGNFSLGPALACTHS